MKGCAIHYFDVIIYVTARCTCKLDIYRLGRHGGSILYATNQRLPINRRKTTSNADILVDEQHMIVQQKHRI